MHLDKMGNLGMDWLRRLSRSILSANVATRTPYLQGNRNMHSPTIATKVLIGQTADGLCLALARASKAGIAPNRTRSSHSGTIREAGVHALMRHQVVNSMRTFKWAVSSEQ